MGIHHIWDQALWPFPRVCGHILPLLDDAVGELREDPSSLMVKPVEGDARVGNVCVLSQDGML